MQHYERGPWIPLRFIQATSLRKEDKIGVN